MTVGGVSWGNEAYGIQIRERSKAKRTAVPRTGERPTRATLVRIGRHGGRRMHSEVVGDARTVVRHNSCAASLSNTRTVSKKGVGLLLRSKTANHARKRDRME